MLSPASEVSSGAQLEESQGMDNDNSNGAGVAVDTVANTDDRSSEAQVPDGMAARRAHADGDGARLAGAAPNRDSAGEIFRKSPHASRQIRSRSDDSALQVRLTITTAPDGDNERDIGTPQDEYSKGLLGALPHPPSPEVSDRSALSEPLPGFLRDGENDDDTDRLDDADDDDDGDDNSNGDGEGVVFDERNGSGSGGRRDSSGSGSGSASARASLCYSGTASTAESSKGGENDILKESLAANGLENNTAEFAREGGQEDAQPVGARGTAFFGRPLGDSDDTTAADGAIALSHEASALPAHTDHSSESQTIARHLPEASAHALAAGMSPAGHAAPSNDTRTLLARRSGRSPRGVPLAKRSSDEGGDASAPVDDDIQSTSSSSIGSTSATSRHRINRSYSSGSANSSVLNERTVCGRYRLGDPLGRGRFGTVRKAVDLETGGLVAVKMLRLDAIPRKQRRSITWEVEILSRLQHPNIVHFLDAKQTKNHLYIVQEFVEGGSLSDQHFSALPETLVALFVEQVLRGLAYLHDEGVSHRDVKGSNILVTKSGCVKIADFGLCAQIHSKRSRSGGRSSAAAAAGAQGLPRRPAAAPSPSSALGSSGLTAGTIEGSPYWMAPEVVNRRGYNLKSDIWSVGCTVIELLTGRPPFADLEPIAAVYHMLCGSEPPIPDKLSLDGAEFLDQCFRRNVNERASAKELLEHPWIVNHALERERRQEAAQKTTGGGGSARPLPPNNAQAQPSTGDESSSSSLPGSSDSHTALIAGGSAPQSPPPTHTSPASPRRRRSSVGRAHSGDAELKDLAESAARLAGSHSSELLRVSFHNNEDVSGNELLQRAASANRSGRLVRSNVERQATSLMLHNEYVLEVLGKRVDLNLIVREARSPYSGMVFRTVGPPWRRRRVFEGAAFVSYLMQHYTVFDSRLEAENFVRTMMNKNHLSHAARGRAADFSDSSELFRFHEDQDPRTRLLNMSHMISNEDRSSSRIVRRFAERLGRIYIEHMRYLSTPTVDEVAYVNYQRLVDSSSFEGYLRYIPLLHKVDLASISREEKVAFVLNLISGLAIHGIVEYGFPRTRCERAWFSRCVRYSIGGTPFSLDDLARRILGVRVGGPRCFIRQRAKEGDGHMQAIHVLPATDPRCLAAVARGFRSDPRPRLYGADTLDSDLRDAAEELCTEGIELDILRRCIVLPRVLKWNRSFFPNRESMLDWVGKHLAEPKRTTFMQIRRETRGYQIRFRRFDWGSNAVPASSDLVSLNLERAVLADRAKRRTAPNADELAGSEIGDAEHRERDRLESQARRKRILQYRGGGSVCPIM